MNASAPWYRAGASLKFCMVAEGKADIYNKPDLRNGDFILGI